MSVRQRMKKKIKSISSRKVVARSLVNPFSKIMVVVAVLLFLVGMLMFYHFVSVGQAYKVEPKGIPYVTPIENTNLDKVGAVHFVINKVNLTTQVTLSFSLEAEDVFVGASILSSGVVSYVVQKGQQGGEVLAQGLLDSVEQSSGDLFLDNDGVADMEIVYSKGVLKVYNLNFMPAAASSVDVSDKLIMGDEKSYLHGPLFFVNNGESKDYYFKVSGSSMPAVTASWKNGETISFTDVTQNVDAQANSKLKFRVMKLIVKPMVEKPLGLVMNISVDNIDVQREFIFAVNGRMYDTGMKEYPHIELLKQNENKAEVKISFDTGSGLYGFSLPCGVVYDLSTWKESVKAVYGFENGKIVQWSVDAPANTNDLSGLEAGRGYLLKLQKEKSFSFTAKCLLKDGFVEQFKPVLNTGWNLVGVRDYTSVDVNALDVPSGKSVLEVYERSLQGDVKNPSRLEPGRAYWVKVGTQ